MKSPIAMATVAGSIAVMLVLIVAAAVGGSYALTLGAIHRANAAASQIRVREQTAQLRSSIPTCKALVQMDNASHVPQRDFPVPPHNQYDLRLENAIHNIVVGSHCDVILKDLKLGETPLTILRQLENGSASAHRNAGSSSRH